MSRRAVYVTALLLMLLLLPLSGFLHLKLHADLDPLLPTPTRHFQVVSTAALLAALLAAAIGVSGVRLRNIQVIFLSMAFTSLSTLFALHGLATPGFILPPSQVPPIASQLSVLLTSFWLWMSSLPSDRPIVVWLSRWQRCLVPVWTSLLLILVAAGLLYPGLVKFVPVHLSPLKWAALIISLTFQTLSVSDYWRAYRYSRFPLQLAILCSTTWLAAAQIIIVTSELWRASWWIYHFLLLGAMLMMIVGLLRQYASGTSVGTAVRSLLSADPAERIEAGIAPSIRALIVATEIRDRYTAGHSYRVALLALRLGESIGLPPEQLRALAQGGIVHDIGKIEVPDQVLNKPGRLEPEERAVIEKHPVTGYAMCKRLGFMPEELAVIRHHHERWDGTGYPDRLAGEKIPLLARILAIADVYDALTSARSYRGAWEHRAALDLICEESGRAFDPACVEAWLKLMQQEPVYGQYPAWLKGEPELLS